MDIDGQVDETNANDRAMISLTCLVMPKHMPEPPPVTIATLPWRASALNGDVAVIFGLNYSRVTDDSGRLDALSE